MRMPARKETERQLGARMRVLNRLMKSPATNVELNALCYRYGARILELRRAGYNVKTLRGTSGVFTYALEPVRIQQSEAA